MGHRSDHCAPLGPTRGPRSWPILSLEVEGHREGRREGMAPDVSPCAGGEEAEPPSLGAQHSTRWLCLGDCPPDLSKHSWSLTGPMKGSGFCLLISSPS